MSIKTNAADGDLISLTIQSAEVKKKKLRAHIKDAIQLQIWIKSGGNCSFCNKDVYTDGHTLKRQKFGEIAHIVSAELDGPRGDDPLPLDQRGCFENLMLVCGDHNKLFDREHEKEYPVEMLREIKKDHESRIRYLHSIKSTAKTKLIKLVAKIGGELPTCSETECGEAIFPMQPLDLPGIEIDLRSIAETRDAAYWTTCKTQIEREMDRLHSISMSKEAIEHVSVFAIAPIPLLICLGRSIGNKFSASIFQRHRDTQNWKWKNDFTPATFSHERVKVGTDSHNVVLVISVSGTISLNQIPQQLENCDVYEIKLASNAPNPGAINMMTDVEYFRVCYQHALAQIRSDRPDVTEIHLMPAIPISLAVTCGRELLEKAHPSLAVYDKNKNSQWFDFALRVNA